MLQPIQIISHSSASTRTRSFLWSSWQLLLLSLVFSLVVSLNPSANATILEDPMEALTSYAKEHPNAWNLEEIAKQPFAKQALSKTQAEKAAAVLSDMFDQFIRADRKSEMDNLVIESGPHKMPFWFKIYGEKPAGGRSLFISMHGGGGAPKTVNDGQWENQKKLYQPSEGVYVAPRSPVEAWNMWHVGQVDELFFRLIQDMVAIHDVNPNRVYIMGYSAGGDGVYQLAPRMADHFGAAAMMAGHPNETTPDGLRNLPFSLQMGGKDSAYRRNEIAAQWKEKLEQLQSEDPKGYPHMVKIYPEYGHWMNREDAIAVDWMAKNDRICFPKRVVWKQDDVIHRRFYWLGNLDAQPNAGDKIVAEFEQQTISIIQSTGITQVALYLSDRWIDIDQPIKVLGTDNQIIFEGKVDRTILSLAKTLETSDREMMASASVNFEIKVPAAKENP